MSKDNTIDNLIVPVYINEKIVLDMLAIMEDGFAMVSQVNYSEHNENQTLHKGEVGVGTDSLLGKLLKIDIDGEVSHTGSKEDNESISKEKVHTNVSLFSKFRKYLVENKAMKSDDLSNAVVGDFIEVCGALQKNPIIDYLDSVEDLFRMLSIFCEAPKLGSKNQTSQQKAQNDALIKQIKSLNEELKHSGTIDFIMSQDNNTVVLSVQEQYLTNDNITEIIGGNFKILGKVIAVCKDSGEEIDLLRKTSLSYLSDEMIAGLTAGFKNENLQSFRLPEFKTKISGPAVIVIPIAIFA